MKTAKIEQKKRIKNTKNYAEKSLLKNQGKLRKQQN